jgi:Uma2 family endonuclease
VRLSPQEFAMSTVLRDASPATWTIADVHAHLPGFPDDRILTCPSPGTATEEDLLEAESRTGFICELIDATLVRKTMASYESMLAIALAYFLQRYLDENDIGSLTGGDGLLRILRRQVRAPDVAFIRWERLPKPGTPKPPIYSAVPDLAAEILSKSNTKAEMDRKLEDYFEAGVRLVWYIDPETRTAKAYTAPVKWTDVGANSSLEGGRVLPGFELPLANLFARVEGPKDI